jgi:hypothetical protein
MHQLDVCSGKFSKTARRRTGDVSYGLFVFQAQDRAAVAAAGTAWK